MSDQHDPVGVLQRFHDGIAVGALALFAVVSLAFQPFTEPYAREIVQRKYWTTARFSRTNVELTLMWAVVFAAIAASLAARASSTPASARPSSLGAADRDPAARRDQATTRWNDQFDGESMGIDALLNQGELWDTPRRRARAGIVRLSNHSISLPA